MKKIEMTVYEFNELNKNEELTKFGYEFIETDRTNVAIESLREKNFFADGIIYENGVN